MQAARARRSLSLSRVGELLQRSIGSPVRGLISAASWACAIGLQSGPVGSPAAIRLLAGTEAMPAWDEAYERAIGQKRLASSMSLPRAQNSALKPPQLYTPARTKPHACSPRPLRRLLRRLTKVARRASRGTPCFIRSTYRCVPITFVRASRHQPSRQQQQRLRSTPAGEHRRNAIAHDDTR